MLIWLMGAVGALTCALAGPGNSQFCIFVALNVDPASTGIVTRIPQPTSVSDSVALQVASWMDSYGVSRSVGSITVLQHANGQFSIGISGGNGGRIGSLTQALSAHLSEIAGRLGIPPDRLVLGPADVPMDGMIRAVNAAGEEMSGCCSERRALFSSVESPVVGVTVIWRGKEGKNNYRIPDRDPRGYQTIQGGYERMVACWECFINSPEVAQRMRKRFP